MPKTVIKDKYKKSPSKGSPRPVPKSSPKQNGRGSKTMKETKPKEQAKIRFPQMTPRRTALAIGSVLALGTVGTYLLNNKEVRSSSDDVKTYQKELDTALTGGRGLISKGLDYVGLSQPPSPQEIMTKFITDKTKLFASNELTKEQMKAVLDVVNNTLVRYIQKPMEAGKEPEAISNDLIKAYARAMSQVNSGTSISTVLDTINNIRKIAIGYFQKS